MYHKCNISYNIHITCTLYILYVHLSMLTHIFTLEVSSLFKITKNYLQSMYVINNIIKVIILYNIIYIICIILYNIILEINYFIKAKIIKVIKIIIKEKLY